METEVLKLIINEQKREIDNLLREEKIIERESLNYVKKFLRYPNIVAILGPRRTGKSIFSLLLSEHFKEKIAYINFDDERLVGVKTEDLNKILGAFYELYGEIELVILDEIQNIRGWELFINRLRRTKRVIITGSNSHLLSGEMSTHLTGRHIDFILHPFSFREVLRFKPDIYHTEDIAKGKRRLDEYIKGSGFPEFRKFGSRIVVGIYEDIITKDCLRRHEIKHKETFRELANYLVSNFSCEFTYSKLSNIFKIRDVHTVKNYLDYLKEAFLIIVVERFSPKLKQQVIAPKKVYAIDHGFCNFISFRLSKNIGKIFENIVCVELLRRKAINHKIGIYYWKNAQQEEVDFVVKQERVQHLIQVCYDISEYDTKKREIKALIKASEELRCENLLVITSDYAAEEQIGNKKIRFRPLWQWLIE